MLKLLHQCRDYNGNPQDFLTLVIEPVLYHLDEIPFDMGAPQLLLGTALTESGGLKYRTQHRNGPARGLFQMESATHDDIWNNFLKYKPKLADQVGNLSLRGGRAESQELIYNDNYSAAMCRIHYYRFIKKLPPYGKIEEHARIWKRYYNTRLGKGTVQKYLADWKVHRGASVKIRLTCGR